MGTIHFSLRREYTYDGSIADENTHTTNQYISTLSYLNRKKEEEDACSNDVEMEGSEFGEYQQSTFHQYPLGILETMMCTGHHHWHQIPQTIRYYTKSP